MIPSRTFALLPHPWASCPWIEGLQAEVEPGAGGALRIRYVLKGDPARLSLPPPGPVQPGERLWEHTCFEVFIAGGTGTEYREFNFSPSKAWATQAFSDYRQRVDAPLPKAPSMELDRQKHALEMEVVLPPGTLPGPGPWRLALAAVVEAADGSRTYWALRHGSGRPDFHAPESFTALVEAR